MMNNFYEEYALKVRDDALRDQFTACVMRAQEEVKTLPEHLRDSLRAKSDDKP